MKRFTLTFTLLFAVFFLSAQEIKFRDNINKDFLFEVSLKKIPEQKRDEIARAYRDGRGEEK